MLIDSTGVLVAAVVTPADAQDRTAFPKLRRAKRIAPTISHVWVDKGYPGQSVTTDAGWSNAPTAGINHRRRIDRHYETTLTAHEGFLYLSQIALSLRRLDRGQLFDTL